MPRQRIWRKRAVAQLLRGTGMVRLRRRKTGLVILMLHKVSDEPDPLPLTLRPALFDQMLGEILAHHPIVDLQQGVRELEEERPGLRFALTFDDGYRDNYEQALPILRRHGVPATIFLSVDFINGDRVLWYEALKQALSTSRATELDLRDVDLGLHELSTANSRQSALMALNYRLKQFSAERRDELLELIQQRGQSAAQVDGSPMLDWTQARAMADDGIAFGSHTMSHPILTRETADAVRREVRESKQVIERELGQPVALFAYPNGTASSFDDAVAEELEAAGYACAATTIPGINQSNTSRFKLKRINIHDGMCTDAEGNFDPAVFWCKALALF